MGEMPDVAIHAVRLVILRNGNPVLLCVRNLGCAGVKIPLAPRSDNLEIRCKRLHGQLEANLIVPLSRRAVCNRIRALTLGDIDERLCNHGTRKRRAEQIFPLVDGTRLERRPDIFLKEFLRQIDNIHLRCTGRERLVMHRCKLLALPDIGTGCNDLASVIVLLQPRDDDRGVKSAGIRKNYLFDLLCHI